MKKRLGSLFLALSMMLMAVPGLGSISVAAEDTQVYYLDAAEVFDYVATTEYATSNQYKPVNDEYGVFVDQDYAWASNCVLIATTNSAATQGKKMIAWQARSEKTADLTETGYIDFTTEAYPATETMTDGVYTLDIEFASLFKTASNGSKNQFRLRGTKPVEDAEEATSAEFATIDIDADGTVSLLNADGTKAGSSVTASMIGTIGFGYLQLNVDMTNKTVSAWAKAYDTADEVDSVVLGGETTSLPGIADCTYLGTVDFYDAEVAQLAQIAVFQQCKEQDQRLAVTEVAANKIDDATAGADVTVDKAGETATVSVQATLGRHGLVALLLDGEAIEDYTVADGTYTLGETTVNALEVGTHTLTFDVDSGADPEVAINVVNSTLGDAAIDKTAASYDKYSEAETGHEAVAVTLTPGGYTLSAVKNGETVLTAGTDYTVEEVVVEDTEEGAGEETQQAAYTVTISTDYLDTLEVGENTLTFEMNGGANPTLVITVSDSTPEAVEYTVTVTAGTGGTARLTTSKTSYLPGERVIVSATASSGYTFSSWTSSDVTITTSGTTGTFTMPEKNVTVRANFVQSSDNNSTSGGRRPSSSDSSTAVVVVGDETSEDIFVPPTIDYASSNYFNDVATYNTWAYGYIEHLAAAGIISGDSSGSFNPGNAITREEFLKMLMGALEINATVTTGSGYSDVNSSDWYAPYVYTATSMGLVNGMGDGTFGVGRTITRQDMAVMASRALSAVGKSLPQTETVALSDLNQISDYALSSVQQLAAAGVICGDEHAAYRPADSAKREDAAKIIYILWKI